ncbi:hypothetical protein HGA13_03245 [Nocardia speluncae]|uniref:ABC transmembrane type-1 domain-containing protein n=1 Tax=Nocardia speluncae TaxID=419477 RepID=A0A846XBB4_9NOCA|nr:hypothetical protein [Nocardia speluncae]NKY32090.1 hypothetical protein [Nocardia speluncae]
MASVAEGPVRSAPGSPASERAVAGTAVTDRAAPGEVVPVVDTPGPAVPGTAVGDPEDSDVRGAGSPVRRTTAQRRPQDRLSRIHRAHGVDLELPLARLRGPLVAGSPPPRGITGIACTPAVLLTAVLLIPAGITVVSAVRTRLWLVVGCAILAAAFVSAVLYARRGDHGARDGSDTAAGRVRRWAAPVSIALVAVIALYLIGPPYARSLYWMGFAAVLLVAAMVLAWWSRNTRGLWLLPLIVPFGISAFVAGVAFRLIFQYSGVQIGFDGFPGYRAWFVVMLGSAFLWTWLGFLIALFRASIRALTADPVRWSRVANESGCALYRRLFALQRPVVLVAGLVVGIAAARVFDVVLIGVPGSMQYRLDSATVHWWRLAGDPATAGEAAAYALPLTVLVAVAAWALQSDLRDRPPGLSAVPAVPYSGRADSGGGFAGYARTAGIGLVVLAAALPVIALLVVALQGPAGWSLRAFTDMWTDPALRKSIQATLWVAFLATVVVVAAAAPLAYRLAVAPEGRWARGTVTMLVVLAVLPAQAYLGPLDTFIDEHGLSGTRIPLVLVHVAAGLPIAVLILRGAVAAPPGSGAADALRGMAAPGTIAQRLFTAAGPALVAVAVLEFVQVWNDFVVGLLISGAGASPWSLLLWGEARRFGENAAQLAAGSLISAVLPVALVLATWRRWIVPGLTGGVLR